MSPSPVWTVGHSNHPLERFIQLLKEANIEFLLDVRSSPYSRFAPHFGRESLAAEMRGHAIRYVFLGDALGGRPEREDHYDREGHALYGLMAQEPRFLDGIDRVLAGAREHRLALMCSCGNPQSCHRRLLVGRVLCERGVELHHVLPDGSVTLERSVSLGRPTDQNSLFDEEEPAWRSAQSVLHKRPQRASSGG